LHIVWTSTWVSYSLCVFILIYIVHVHESKIKGKTNVGYGGQVIENTPRGGE